MNLMDEGILLRAIEQEDNEVLRNLINDPEVEAKVEGWSFPVSYEKQMQWYQSITSKTDKSAVRFAVDLDGKCIGMAALHEIDYKNSNAGIDIKLIKESRSRGIGCKIVKILVKYAFDELNLHTLFAKVLEDNTASRKTFEKAGFTLDGTMRNRIYKNGRYHGQCEYSILKSEYKKV